MDQPDDRELLVVARADPAAFACFYRRHVHGIQRWFARRGVGAETAFDLTAETFARALRGLDRYEPGPSPGVAWLYGIARNLWRDAARRGRVEDTARRALAMEPIVLDDDAVAWLVADGGTPALDALDLLPPEQRDAIVARHVQEDDYPEIARRMGCSESVVRQRVSRGLRTLRDRLEDCADV
ncbi:RNA polymerase sigma factor [Baekduia soli]|nr:RNA polymerase sigma factor [Baekduia soli]